jgi:GTP-binding protein
MCRRRQVAANADKPFQILNVLIESDPFLGRLLTGRIEIRQGRSRHGHQGPGPRRQEIEQGRITKVLAFRGLKRQPVDEGAEAGDIVAIAGMSKATVADTLCAWKSPRPCPPSRSIRRPSP